MGHGTSSALQPGNRWGVAESSTDRNARVMTVCLEMGKALESLGEKDGKRSRDTG